MRIIDRYVLRQFVQVFIICFVSLTGMYMVFDAFANLDEFIRYSEKNGGLLGIMAEYYAYRGIFFFDRSSGIVAMIAAMFTVTWLRRHNELTALMAAGVSGRRVVLPVILAAGTISAVAAINRELTIPACRGKLSRDPKDLMGDVAQDIPRPRYDHETDILLRGKKSFAGERRVHKPNFGLPDTLRHWGRQLMADDAFYKAAANGHPEGYLLVGVSQPPKIDEMPSAVLGQRQVIITHRDAPDWVRPGECFVASNVSFEQLTGGQGWRKFSGTSELIRGVQNPSLDYGADVRLTIHSRMVQPFMDLTLLFLGLPMVLTREGRNIFIAVGICLVLVAGFLLVILACQYLGTNHVVTPAQAAWLPLLLFVPIAVGLADRMKI